MTPTELTLLDYFAAHAPVTDSDPERNARRAYDHAEAMLREREARMTPLVKPDSCAHGSIRYDVLTDAFRCVACDAKVNAQRVPL